MASRALPDLITPRFFPHPSPDHCLPWVRLTYFYLQNGNMLSLPSGPGMGCSVCLNSVLPLFSLGLSSSIFRSQLKDHLLHSASQHHKSGALLCASTACCTHSLLWNNLPIRVPASLPSLWATWSLRWVPQSYDQLPTWCLLLDAYKHVGPNPASRYQTPTAPPKRFLPQSFPSQQTAPASI